jgi:hypothetical protein
VDGLESVSTSLEGTEAEVGNYFYQTKLEGIIHIWLRELYPADFADECGQAVIMTLEADAKRGLLTAETFELFQTQKLSDFDAALYLLDCALRSIKTVVEGTDDAGILQIVKGLEEVIDARMIREPGKYLPRNGKFAEAASQVGLDKFFRT